MNVGGVERGILDFAKYFNETENEIVVVSGGGKLIKELEKFNIQHYKLNVYKKSPLSLLSIKKLRRIIEKEKGGIVHARSRVPAWIAFFATRRSNVEFITTAHGFYSPHFLSYIMSLGKFVICPSKVIARHMQEAFGVSPAKIKIIPRWVDLDRFKFTPEREKTEDTTLLSVGRISPSKGYEYLISAMRRIVRVNPYIRLDIVGSAESNRERYFNYLKSLVQRYSLNYNIRFLGYRDDIEKILSYAHLLVVSSVIEESFGRVIIEAMAVGVPVVATKVGAIPEIVEDKKDGFLVPPRDPHALSKTILEILRNKSVTEKIILNARKKVEKKYSSLGCIKEIHDLYRKAKEFKRILVIKISSLGDIILAIPSLKAIKERYPYSEVTLLILKKYISLLHDCPFVDRIIGLDNNYKKISYLFSISLKLCRMSFDYIIDFQNSFASHIVSFLSFPKRSFGYRRKWGFLLTNSIRIKKKEENPLDSQENILKLLGIKLQKKELTFWSTKDSSLEKFGIFKNDKLIGINISASFKWKSKNWPLLYIRKLIELISKELRDYKVVLLGDSYSLRDSNNLVEYFKGKIISLCGKTTLKDLVAVVRMCKVFITQDTATLHLACALNTKTIAIFGPTNPSYHTVKSKNLRIIYERLPCSFCYKRKCGHHTCMKSITPQKVFFQVKSILKE